MRTFFFLIIIIFLFNVTCMPDLENNSNHIKSKANKIMVRDLNSKKITSAYTLDNESRVNSAAYTNRFGSEVIEAYNYDSSGALIRIDRTINNENNDVNKAETIYFSTTRSKKTVTIYPQTRGGFEKELVTQYFYDGVKVVGMTQTDSFGNIIAKGEEE